MGNFEEKILQKNIKSSLWKFVGVFLVFVFVVVWISVFVFMKIKEKEKVDLTKTIVQTLKTKTEKPKEIQKKDVEKKVFIIFKYDNETYKTTFKSFLENKQFLLNTLWKKDVTLVSFDWKTLNMKIKKGNFKILYSKKVIEYYNKLLKTKK